MSMEHNALFVYVESCRHISAKIVAMTGITIQVWTLEDIIGTFCLVCVRRPISSLYDSCDLKGLVCMCLRACARAVCT